MFCLPKTAWPPTWTGLAAKGWRKSSRSSQAGNLERGGTLARAGQVTHGRHDEGREKAVVGAGDEGFLHGAWRQTRGRKSSRGERAGRGLTHCVSPRTLTWSKALKAGGSFWSRSFNGSAGAASQRQEGNGERRARAAGCEGKTLKSEPWTWLRGETNPRR